MTFYSLRTRLVLLVTVGLLPVFGLLTYNSLQRQQESLKQARQDLETNAKLAALSYESTARSASHLLQAITSAPAVKNYDANACASYFQALSQSFSEYSILGLADLDGRVVCHGLKRDEVIYVTDRDYFQRALATRDFAVGSYLVGRVSGADAITFAMPSVDSESRVTGVAFAAIDLQRLASDNPLGPAQKAQLAVTDRQGTVVASADLSTTPIGSQYSSRFAPGTATSAAGPTSDTVDAAGFEVMHTRIAVGGGTTPGLFVHSSLRKQDVTRGDQNRLTQSLLWMFFLTLMGALAANWLGVKTIVVPSERLLRKVRGLTGSAPPGPAGPVRKLWGVDELAALSNAVDHLSDTLAERQLARDIAENNIRRRLLHNEGLTALALDLAQADSLQAIFQNACDQLASLLGTELTAVLQPLDGGQQLQLVAGTGWGADTIGRALLDATPGSLADWTLNASVPVRLTSQQPETRFALPELLVNPPIADGLQARIRKEGMPWGVLGVYTRQPGTDLADDAHAVQSVAYMLSVAIDRLAAQQSVAQSLHSMNEAQRMAQLGSWELELPGRKLKWSPEVFRIFGLEPDASVETYDAFLAMVHPDDRAAMHAAHLAALTGTPLEIEHRIVRSSGEVRHVRERGELVRNAAGQPTVLAGTVLDITTRKNTELRLARNQALVQMASRISHLGAWRMALPSGDVALSDEVRVIIGIGPSDDFTAEFGFNCYAPEYIGRLREVISACANEGISFDIEAEIIRHGSERVWVRVIAEPDRNEDGVIIGVQGAIQDISARKDTERQLGKLNARLVNTLESITDAFFLLNDQWQFLFVNPQAARLLHRSPQSLMGTCIWDEFPGTRGSIVEDRFRQALQDNLPQRFEFYYAPFELWFRINAYATEDGLAIYFQDITAEREAAAQLKLLETAVSRLNDMVIINDMPRTPDELPRVVFVNTAFTARSGYEIEDVLGHPLTFFKGSQTSAEEMNRVASEMRLLQPVRSEMIVYSKRGVPLWVEMEIAPIFNNAGRATHWVTVCRDISERKASQDAILQLNADLENRVALRTAELRAANEELDAFSYSVSHDLRSPLNTIDGFSQMLQKYDSANLSDKGQHYLRRIRGGAQQMNELILGLLGLARLSQEPMKVQPVDLSAIARRVVLELRDQAPAREVDIIIQDALLTHADPLQMRVVLQNLIGNAWKFTGQQAQARIEIGCDEAGADASPVYFIRDNGAGFDMAFANKLFKIFERLHPSADFSGTGVGLTIVKRVVNRHGGKVWAHSTAGQGATFYFTLAAQPDDAGEDPAVAPTSPA